MRTIKASEVRKGMRVRVEQPWGPETTRTVEGPIRRVEDRAPHFRFLTIGNGDLTVDPDHPVTVLAEPEPEWVEGAWYWTQTAGQTSPRIRKRMERGWGSVGVDGTNTVWLDNGAADITVLGRVLIVDWPGDDVARTLAKWPDGTAPLRYLDKAVEKVADAIRTQGGAP